MALRHWAECPTEENVQGKLSRARVFKNTRFSVSAVF